MKKILLIALFGMSLVLTGCTQKTSVQDQDLNQPVVDQQVANVEIDKPVDPTAEFLTFTNNDFGYSVQYPKEFSVKEWADIIKADTPSGVNSSILSVVIFGNNTELGDGQIGIGVSSKTLEQEKELVKLSVSNAWKNEEEILIDGVKATKHIGDGGEGVSGKTVSIIMSYKERTYKLTYSEVNDKTDRLEIFNQMIQTFKFSK